MDSVQLVQRVKGDTMQMLVFIGTNLLPGREAVREGPTINCEAYTAQDGYTVMLVLSYPCISLLVTHLAYSSLCHLISSLLIEFYIDSFFLTLCFVILLLPYSSTFTLTHCH